MKLTTSAQMRELDRIAIEVRGIPSIELMERAAEGVASAVLELLFHQGARHGGGERMTVTVALNGRTKEICALHDTGNTLRNPMDGQGVLVMERGALLSLLPPWERTLLREGLAPEETMARLYQGETRLHFTLLPYRAVGTASGLLLAVRSDYIAFGRRRYPRALIALSPGPVSDGGGYCALWGGEEGGEGVDRASARAAASAPANAPAVRSRWNLNPSNNAVSR